MSDVANYLWKRRFVRGDERCATLHRLERGNPEALVQRWKDKCGAAAEQSCLVLFTELTCEDHLVFQAELADQRAWVGIERVAKLVDPTGKGHVIQRGQFVGRPDVVQGTGRSGSTYEVNWRVDTIRDGDVVLVRSDPANPDVPTATRVIPLRPEGTRVER